MASSTRVEPLCIGKWMWSQSVGTDSMAAMISGPKCRGCEVVNRTRLIPGDRAHRRQQFGKSHFSGRILVGINDLAQKLDFGITEVGHLPGFCQN